MTGRRHLRSLLLVVLVTGLRAEEKPASESGNSGNWLVDAMSEKPAGPKGGPAEAALLGARAPGTAAVQAGSRPDGSTVNPLSNYLATWMTPHDLEVLKLKDAEPNPTIPGGTAGRRNQPPATLTAGAPANPYLAGLAPAASADGKAPVNPPAALTRPAPAALAAKSDAAPAKTPGPPAEVLKSQDDAKYFPQLKRF